MSADDIIIRFVATAAILGSVVCGAIGFIDIIVTFIRWFAQ